MGSDELLKVGDWKPRGKKGFGHGVPGGAGRQRINPPLLADLAQLRFADEGGNAGDFGVEGIESLQFLTGAVGRKEACEVTVAVSCSKALDHQASSTATRAAATRRPSAKSTFQVRTAEPVFM